MKHIFLIDDYPGKAKDLALQILENYVNTDIKVHLFMVFNKCSQITPESHFASIKKDFIPRVHFNADKKLDDVFAHKIFPYENEEKFYGSAMSEFVDELDMTIKDDAQGDSFAVGIDMLLIGDRDGEFDHNRIKTDPTQKVLSHYICELYLDKCRLYSSVPYVAEANFDKWVQALDDPNNTKIKFTSKYNIVGAELNKLAKELFNLCS